MFKNKLLLRILLNSLLGVFLIVIWSRFVNISEVIGILKTVEIKYIFTFSFLVFFAGLLRSLRLKLLLKTYKLPLKDLLMLTFLGQFLSFFIPLRVGEVAKGVYLNSTFELPLGKTLVWVFIDRFLDFWVVLFLASLLFLFIPTNLPANANIWVLLLLVIFTLFSVFMVVSQNFSKKSTSLLANIVPIKKVKEGFISFTHTIIEGFEILRQNPLNLLILLVLTLAATFLEALVWLFIFLSLGVDFGLGKLVLGSVLNALTFLIPAAPGYVGSAEAAALAVFSGVLGVEANIASAASVLFHILSIITILILGISSLYFLKFDLKLVWKKLRKE